MKKLVVQINNILIQSFIKFPFLLNLSVMVKSLFPINWKMDIAPVVKKSQESGYERKESALFIFKTCFWVPDCSDFIRPGFHISVHS